MEITTRRRPNSPSHDFVGNHGNPAGFHLQGIRNFNTHPSLDKFEPIRRRRKQPGHKRVFLEGPGQHETQLAHIPELSSPNIELVSH